MKRQKELSSRQWKLYSWLKKQKDYKTLRDIMIETGLYGDNHDVYNSSGGRALRKENGKKSKERLSCKKYRIKKQD